jgi:16S rRNA (cytidine1402-2'-O)-methyltransferase
MEDLTPRALRILRECDLVAAEDTRRTGMLLKRLEINKPMISCFKFNEARRSNEILEKLKSGSKIALVTDAGTPGISDPGERVIQAAVERGIPVEPIPGACAFVTALMAGGLPTAEFHFLGFLPQKPGKRRKELERLKSVAGTLRRSENSQRSSQCTPPACHRPNSNACSANPKKPA